MEYAILRTELTTDPLGRGYGGLSDQAAADALNVANRVVTRSSVLGSEIIAATVQTEYAALSADQKQIFCGMVDAGGVNPSDSNTRTIFGALFGAGTTTRANLLALQNRTVSRAVELGLGLVTAGDVKLARGGVW